MKPEEAQSETPERQPVVRLGLFWQACVAEPSRMAPQRPLSAKEMGQLKQLRNYLGKETENVIGWAVDNWPRFAWRARAEAGLPSHPGNPHIGFLLKHHAIAVNLLQPSAPQPRVSIDTPHESAQRQWMRHLEEMKANAHRITADELEEMIAGLKE